ncbi:hypothetical protein ACVW0P_003635 [Mucilaginibacter sp. UYNi724]
MKYKINRDSSKGILLAPQIQNRISDLSSYKVEKSICIFQFYYQKVIQLICHVVSLSLIVWKILNIILWLWSHPRPDII